MSMFENLDYYKPDLDKTFTMMTKAYDDAFGKRGGNVSFRALPPVDLIDSKLDLTRYDFESDSDIEKYADDYCRISAHAFKSRREIDDNFLPALNPFLGIGEYSAFVVGEIEFQLRFDGLEGAPYPWLFVDPDVACSAANRWGFEFEVVAEGERGSYLARLGACSA